LLFGTETMLRVRVAQVASVVEHSSRQVPASASSTAAVDAAVERWVA
jgi:hypothetical protein